MFKKKTNKMAITQKILNYFKKKTENINIKFDT